MNRKHIRRLRDCQKKHFKNAVEETLYTVGAALLPIVFGLVGVILIPKLKSDSVFDAFFQSNSPIFVAASLVGPIIYILLGKYGRFNGTVSYEFPGKKLIWPAALLILLLAVFVFGLSLAITGAGDGNQKPYFELIDASVLENVSKIALSFSIGATVLVLTIRNLLDDETLAPQVMRSETDDLIDDWNRP